jgi:hypothetical protein
VPLTPYKHPVPTLANAYELALAFMNGCRNGITNGWVAVNRESCWLHVGAVGGAPSCDAGMESSTVASAGTLCESITGMTVPQRLASGPFIPLIG